MRISRALALSLYRTMVELREFELKAYEIFRSGRMPGFIHLYVGEEAVATGVIAHLKKDDYVTSTHRGHGHAVAKGISAREAMAELMGTVGGCCGGRGGSTAAGAGTAGRGQGVSRSPQPNTFAHQGWHGIMGVPAVAEGRSWIGLVDTSAPERATEEYPFDHALPVAGRSLLLLVLSTSRVSTALRRGRDAILSVAETPLNG